MGRGEAPTPALTDTQLAERHVPQNVLPKDSSCPGRDKTHRLYNSRSIQQLQLCKAPIDAPQETYYITQTNEF